VCTCTRNVTASAGTRAFPVGQRGRLQLTPADATKIGLFMAKNRRALTLPSGKTSGNTGRQKLPEDAQDTASHPPSRLELTQQKLGQKIRRFREKKALSEQRLGLDCGISATKMRKIEAGTVDPGVCTIIRIAQRLNVKPVDLFGGIS
jgi:DNA-binding XRE family transcriptional regulator